MCIYCYCGDQTFKWDPPWQKPTIPTPMQPWHPLIPAPQDPNKQIIPWDIERLKEYRDLLLQIHELEEKVGCECEPNKADYLSLIKQRIEALEKHNKDPDK
jgi:hypothetical protein